MLGSLVFLYDSCFDVSDYFSESPGEQGEAVVRLMVIDFTVKRKKKADMNKV